MSTSVSYPVSFDPPLGIVLILKDEAAERILFRHPDGASSTGGKYATGPRTYSTSSNQESTNSTTAKSPSFVGADRGQFEVPVKMLGPLLLGSREEREGGPFEIKVDSIRFAGHPFTIEGTAHSLAVVFVLGGRVPSHIVDSFQKLSKKIAIAINNEQKRCNYLTEQIHIMQTAHDDFEAALETVEARRMQTPNPSILAKSGLAQHLKEVFEDVCEYGMIDVFIDDCIEVGFCVEPKALLHAGLAPKSTREVETIMRQVHPYHGILFLEDSRPSVDSNPVVTRFLEAYDPSRRHAIINSLEELGTLSGLLPSQVLQLVKHYLMWVCIYPVCSTNVYSAVSPLVPFSKLADEFEERFPQCSLAEVCEHFSPPNTLGAFLVDSALYSPILVRMQMIIFLLRNQLCVQHHTFFYLLPPLSNNQIPSCADKDKILSPRIKAAVNSVKELSPAIRDGLLNLCALSVMSHVNETEIFWLVNTFVSFIPYLDGKHHLEDIMYRVGLDRTTMMRVLDSFTPLIATFSCPDLMLEDAT